MRVFGLNKGFEKVKQFDFIQLLWNRKFYEPGDFTIYCHASDHKKDSFGDIEYISLDGRSEMAFLYKTDFQASTNGEFVTCTGKFLEDLANDVSTDLGKDISSNLNTQLANLVKEVIPIHLVVGSEEDELEERAVAIEKHQKAGEAIYKALKPKKESFTVTRYGDSHRLKFQKARDNTDLVFSRGSGNLAKASYSIDMSGYYHHLKGYVEIPHDVVSSSGYQGVVKVGGKFYAHDTYTSTLEVSERMKKRTLTKDFSLPEGIEVTQANDGRIKQAIRDMCKLELLNYYVEKTVDIEPLQVDGCRYREDYDLGDLITIRIDEIDLVYEAQIVEVQETWQKNTHNIKLIIGNKRMKR